MTWGERLASRMGVRPSVGSDEPYLDGLRACAVLAVVIIHTHAAAGRAPIVIFGVDLTFFPVTGTYGVLLFFILSGFLLARPWFRDELTGTPRPKIGRFWFRRFLRVAPAYYVSIAVILLVFVPNTVAPVSLQGGLGALNVGTHLLFAQQLIPVTSSNFFDVGGVYWTLTLEMTFYLVLPFVMPLFTGWRWRITLPLSALGTALWIYLCSYRSARVVNAMIDSVSPTDAANAGVTATPSHMQSVLINQFPTYLFTFALGICLARLVVLHETRRSERPDDAPAWWARPRVGLFALIAALSGLVFSQHEAGESILHPTLSSIWWILFHNLFASTVIAGLVFAFTFGPAWSRRPLTVIPMRYLGWTSFGIYLYHVPVIAFLSAHTDVATLSPHRQLAFFFGATLGIALVLATLSWMLIERPLLTWRPRRPSFSLVGPAAAAIACVLIAVAVSFRVSDVQAVAAAAPRSANLVPLLPIPIDHGVIQPGATGDGTLDQAIGRGVLYPFQQSLLAACLSPGLPGVPPPSPLGSTVLMVAPEWSVLGSAFPCRDAASAANVVDQLAAWEASIGFENVPADGRALWPPGVYFSDANPPTPAFPAQIHVFYVSGTQVVGLLLQAKDRTVGLQGAEDLLTAITPQYPL